MITSQAVGITKSGEICVVVIHASSIPVMKLALRQSSIEVAKTIFQGSLLHHAVTTRFSVRLALELRN